MGKPRTVDMWQMGLRNEYDYRTVEALDACIDNTTLAIGKLEFEIKSGIRDEQGKMIEKPHGIDTEETTKDTAELPIQLFDKMQFHPRVIAASKSLFRDGHYASAILEAYKAVNNFVKKKTNLALDGKALMSKVFSEDVPVIKLNELLTQSDRDEQEGFKFLFMGAMVGIRNPKAHDNVIQTDPYRTLEYLVFASLLMRRVEESTVVKTSLPRTKWDWDRFLADTKSKCELGIVRLAANLYEFTRSNSDFISWGTGNQDGSFTFRKLRLGGMISIFSMYSCGWIYINFGSLKNKNVPGNIMDSFRYNLNTIQNINIPKESVTNGKFARIYEKPLTNSKNLKLFQDAIISLCQQIE
ncbi:hypothetical protein ES708_06211 [subsurface metagenome]